MTQEELDKLIAYISGTGGSIVFSLKQIEMDEKTMEKVMLAIAIQHATLLKLIKSDFANGLVMRDSAEALINVLNNIDEERRQNEAKRVK